MVHHVQSTSSCKEITLTCGKEFNSLVDGYDYIYEKITCPTCRAIIRERRIMEINARVRICLELGLLNVADSLLEEKIKYM